MNFTREPKDLSAQQIKAFHEHLKGLYDDTWMDWMDKWDSSKIKDGNTKPSIILTEKITKELLK